MTAHAPRDSRIHSHDHDHEEATAPVQAPIVDNTKADRLNPEVEYEVLALGDAAPAALQEKLNELGKDGWQLVATTPAFIFRRMKKPEEKKQKSRVGFAV